MDSVLKILLYARRQEEAEKHIKYEKVTSEHKTLN
jgi:hypothetical protein